MTNRVNCIMLVDDNKIDNFFHERVIKKKDAAETIVCKNSAYDALDYLNAGETLPDIIFLDINMPGMNGWEFIEAFRHLGYCKALVIIFTNAYKDPDENALEVVKDVFFDFRPKPLTQEMLDEVLEKYRSKS